MDAARNQRWSYRSLRPPHMLAVPRALRSGTSSAIEPPPRREELGSTAACAFACTHSSTRSYASHTCYRTDHWSQELAASSPVQSSVGRSCSTPQDVDEMLEGVVSALVSVLCLVDVIVMYAPMNADGFVDT